MSKEKALQNLKTECQTCLVCGLSETRKNVVFSDGSYDASILLIGEAPGAQEDEVGKPFVGRAGKLLNQFFEIVGISREKDIYICNTIKCRPPENRVPTEFEKNACKIFLLKQIEIIKPKVILLCGATAMNTFLGKKQKISKIRGQWFEIFEERIKTMVIFHPSYLLRNHSMETNSPRNLMIEDLKKVKAFTESAKP